jgi:3D (Asp-Asp-Asp) domain-containing protein/predicted  nucleic acid-binding Zn-ribbon protein
VAAGLAVAAIVPIALGADSSSLRSQADGLRTQQVALGDRSHASLLELYALESTLSTARVQVAALAAKRQDLRRRHAATRRHLATASRAARVSQRRLEELLRSLYQRNEIDPLAVVLGAESLDEALTGLDSLNRAGRENIRVVERAQAARGRLTRLSARLAAREGELAQVVAAAKARAGELEAAVSARRATIADLRRRQDLTAREIGSLEAQARTAQERTAELTTSAAARSAPAEPTEVTQPIVLAASNGVRTMTVDSVGYSLPGHTASGLPVGHGIVAVDPSVIPLGTRMVVPGYGEAVAADTGSAVRGALIDLWFPTVAAARAWGRRTVVITLR